MADVVRFDDHLVEEVPHAGFVGHSRDYRAHEVEGKVRVVVCHRRLQTIEFHFVEILFGEFSRAQSTVGEPF